MKFGREQGYSTFQTDHPTLSGAAPAVVCMAIFLLWFPSFLGLHFHFLLPLLCNSLIPIQQEAGGPPVALATLERRVASGLDTARCWASISAHLAPRRGVD